MSNDYDIEFRVGCVRFNEGDPDYILDWEKMPLGQFSTLNASIAWMNRRYEPYWGDFEEFQLDALHYAAENMREHAVSPYRYIVLITDSNFHDGTGGSVVTKAHVLDDLESPAGAQASVYISLWQDPQFPWLDAYYDDLTVYDGALDPCDRESIEPSNLYPLSALRTRILERVLQ